MSEADAISSDESLFSLRPALDPCYAAYWPIRPNARHVIDITSFEPRRYQAFPNHPQQLEVFEQIINSTER